MFSEHYHHQYYRSHGANCSSGAVVPHFLTRNSIGSCPMQSSADIGSINSTSLQGYVGYCCDVKPQIDVKPNKNDLIKLPSASLNGINDQISQTTNTPHLIDDKQHLMTPAHLNTHEPNKQQNELNNPSTCPVDGLIVEPKSDIICRQGKINKKRKRREHGCTKSTTKPFR